MWWCKKIKGVPRLKAVAPLHFYKLILMRNYFIIAFSMLLIFSSCEISVKRGDSKEESKSKIRNGITIQPKGIKVEQAFLLKEDGSLLPDDNKVSVNEKIKLRLVVSGWKEKDGKVFIDASEKLETSESNVILDEKNLFGAYGDGLSPEDAKYITLSVVITQIDKLYDFYRVSFQVKDLNDQQNSVEGFYKLYIQ